MSNGSRSTTESVLEDDARSSFVFRDIELPYSFSLVELNVVVNTYFRQECVLRKLAEGSGHKVCHRYDRITSHSQYKYRSTRCLLPKPKRVV